MSTWEHRYNEQTALCVQLIDERDRLAELLERADFMLDYYGLGSQGSPLRVSIAESLTNYRNSQRLKGLK